MAEQETFLGFSQKLPYLLVFFMRHRRRFTLLALQITWLSCVLIVPPGSPFLALTELLLTWLLLLLHLEVPNLFSLILVLDLDYLGR